MKQRTKRFCAVLLASLGPALVARAATDTTPPTITVSNVVGECRNPTVSVFINPRVQDNVDPLPAVTITDRVSGDPTGYPANTDPDQYPLGSRIVTVRACDHTAPTPNCATKQVTVTIRDTLPPAISAGQNKVAQCTSPNGILPYVSTTGTPYCADTCDAQCPACASPATAGTSSCTTCRNACMASCQADATRVHLDRPAVSDVCDPAPHWLSGAPPSNYPIGNTTLSVLGYDRAGNQATKTVRVSVVDTAPPTFTTLPASFNVVSQAANPASPGYCASAGAGHNQPGTQVVLPSLSATDVCTAAGNLTYSWSYPGSLTASGAPGASPQPIACLANGATTVQFVVADRAGNLDTAGGAPATTATVTVGAQAGFPVQLSVTSRPVGYVATGTLVLDSSGGTAPLAWTFVGGAPPTSQSQPTASSVSATFAAEGTFCPLYISATDSAQHGGATPAECFAVDATAPTHTFTSIPSAASQPLGATPVFSHGAQMPLEVAARDVAGAVTSGLARVTATVVPASGPVTVVYDNTYCSNPTGTTAALPACAASHFVAGCNQLAAPVCTCTAISGSGDCATSGRLDLAQLPEGTYTMQVRVQDLAGNSQTQSYPFAVRTFAQALVGQNPALPTGGLVAMLQALAAQPTTPASAGSSLATAVRYLQSASAVFLESPGQGFVLARNAWGALDAARAYGADVAYYQNAVAQAVGGEVRRLVAATQAAANGGALGTWSILADPATRNAYRSRQFLTKRGGIFRDYAVNAGDTLTLASKVLQVSDQHLARSESSAAIDSAIAVHDVLATLYTDNVQATLYGRPLRTLDVGTAATPHVIAEAYYGQGVPSHFGAEIAATVSAQVARFAALAQAGTLAGVPATAVNTLQSVKAKLDVFAAAVGVVQQSNWDPTHANFSNRRLTTDVYLTAIQALQQLATVQAASIYTRYWQTALGLTLADVVNFSQYEGPTALACVLWGYETDGYGNSGYFQGCSRVAARGAPLILNMIGNLPQGQVMDWEAQVAECRYSQMLYALGDGRLSQNGAGAIDLFVASRCPIIDLYNRYYGSGQYLAADTPINPTDYGCPTTPVAFSQADAGAACGGCGVAGSVPKCAPNDGCDTTCDGIDDDCNGLVDDNVATVACGCPGLVSGICPCQSQSDCRLGQAVECVPGVAPSSLDVLCNGVDNNCNGTLAEDYRPTTCGVGGCVSASVCQNGQEQACSPKVASAELCNGIDDNCNIVVDEGLDSDGDGFSCPPCTLYASASSCGGQLGCQWTGSACQSRVGVACSACIPGQGGCSNALLCRGDVAGGAWTGQWDCDDTDPTVGPGLPEICDGKDNNCNGQIDEGQTNACGNCEPSCAATLVGLGAVGAPFTPSPNNAQNVVQDPNTGALGLATQNIDAQFAWIANYDVGTVSRIDTRTGAEVGRYCSALKTGVTTFVRPGGRDPTGATYDTRAEPTICAACSGCNDTSRTAVDQAGNVIVGNRALSYQGSYTKIAGSVNGCVDVDGDGVIRTSRDVNGDGVINPDQTLPAATREYWGELDECILYTRRGVVWEGATQPGCNTPGWPPNNAAVDPANTSFSDERTTCLADPTGVCRWVNDCEGNGNPACASRPNSASCGVTAGCVWSGGYCYAYGCGTWNNDRASCRSVPGCTWNQLCYNLATGPVGVLTPPPIPRAVAFDRGGDAWIGLFNAYGFLQVNPATGKVKRWVTTNTAPYGAAIDKNGILWSPHSCCAGPLLASLNTNATTITYKNPANNTTTFTWPPYGVNIHSASYGGSYGVAVDGLNRVYIGSYPSGTDAAYRFDPSTNSWTNFPVSRQADGSQTPWSGVGRGLTVDASGRLWVAQHGGNGGLLTGFDTTTKAPILDVVLYPNGIIPVGVGIGYGGTVWTANQATKNVTVVNPSTGTVGYYPVGGSPYTYSDFTGSILRTFTSPSGTYSEILDACYGFQVSSWVNLIWNALQPVGTANQGTTASETRVRFRLRAAQTLVTRDAQNNSVDPIAASKWSLWFPDDVADPAKNPGDTSRTYYYDLPASAPTAAPCAGNYNHTYNSASGAYQVTGCADLTALPTTYTWDPAQPNQPISYIQIQALLLADGDNTKQPSLMNFQVARTCPQL